MEYGVIIQPDGLHLHPWANISICKEIRERYEPILYDLTLVTYPKCGTAWMQQILCLWIRGSDTCVNTLEDAKWIECSLH